MITIEKRSVPAVALINKGFIHDARSAASNKGVPNLRLIPEPIPSECAIPEQIDKGVSAVLDDIIAGLTSPLNAEEKSPKPKETAKTSRIVFGGDLKEVNRFFYQRGWSDGLPLIPPTEEEVAEMLTGTNLPADYLVGECPPRMGKATVEKIAINAVMAGALPTYMPLLITALQAMLEHGYFRGQAVSAGSWAPCYIVNGPIRQEININCGIGVMNPGEITNSTIGRAMGLIVKNIGGIRKGVEDMGSLGNPGKHGIVIGENEEESPWEPLHVERGFKKEDNVVTISFPGSGPIQVGVYDTSAEGLLRTVIYNVNPATHAVNSLILTPTHARVLADEGWSKQEVKEFIAEYARAPLSHHPYYWGATLSMPRKTVKGMTGLKGMLLNAKDSLDESVGILRSPDLIKIVVSGGQGGSLGMFTGVGRWTSKKVQLPANWDSLVNKYKDIKPNYSKY